MPSYCSVRSSPSVAPPMTRAILGFRRRFSALRVDASVSKTISNCSLIAKPTTAACDAPVGDTDASTASRWERRKSRSAFAVIRFSFSPHPLRRLLVFETHLVHELGVHPEFLVHLDGPWLRVGLR